MDARTLNINLISKHPTLDYAAQELEAALRKVLGQEYNIAIFQQDEYRPSERNSLWIGLIESFPDNSIPLPDVEIPSLDDVVHIDVKGLNGLIAGINPRSVLLAAYRYLTELGFRWIRPGSDGEIIPRSISLEIAVEITEKASYRHRGICIEGAVSYENVADLIDWAPKIGFNSYFIQFMKPYPFFQRWYAHRNNPYLEPETLELGHVEQFVEKLEGEIQKRGLIYHAVGHGWTCEPFGIPGLGWDQKQHEASPEVVQYMAEVNGQRGLWQGVPLNTNLCYSNPTARTIVIESISSYLQMNRGVDFLHVWLADDMNNQCECDNCKEAIPSDFYVRLLNELDEKLTDKRIETKIVFLVYFDLLWPPQFETLVNQNRFTLMFAPITRSYSSSYESNKAPVELPRYERNKLKFSKAVEDNLGLLQGWKKVFQGDSFDFDYHFMWDHYKDPGYYRIAELLSKDIKNLRNIGLNGYISCQTQRAFFPTGLGMYVMGKTLWNDQAVFEELAEDYFEAAFGENGDACKSYLSRLSELFDPPYLRKEKPQASPESKQAFEEIPKWIQAFKASGAFRAKASNNRQLKSWEYLAYHAELCELLAAALVARASGAHDLAWDRWQHAKDYAQQIEKEVQPVFDVFEFVLTFEDQLFKSSL